MHWQQFVVVHSLVTPHVINISLSDSNGQLHLENFAKLHLATIFICVTHTVYSLVPLEKLQLRVISIPPI